jgi:F-type H+-transporting ATPase subunit b
MKKLFATLALAVALTMAPAIAQEQGGSEKGSSARTAEQTGNSGAEKPGLLIWQWINFALLVGVLGWLASKQGGPFFAGRAKGIAEGLAAGEKAKNEAEARARSVDERLANLKNEIADMRSRAREEREREADRIRRDTQAEIARIRTHAEQELESAGKLAKLEVQRFAAKLAIDLAEQKIRSRMSSETERALFDRFLRDLPDGSARAQTN